MCELVSPPEPDEQLDPESVLVNDPGLSPLPGWPKLGKKGAILVRHRAANPTATWAASKAAAGMHSKSRVSPDVRRYISAMSRFIGAGSLAPADLRQKVISRLARTVQHGDDRESSVAAKTLEGYLPKPKADETQVLTTLGDTALLDRLSGVLQELRDTGLGDYLSVSVEESSTYEDLTFPRGGNGEPRVVPLEESLVPPNPASEKTTKPLI